MEALLIGTAFLLLLLLIEGIRLAVTWVRDWLRIRRRLRDFVSHP